MGLFDAFKKKPAPAPLPQVTGQTYKFINSRGFRGYKRFYLVTRNYPSAQEGIAAIRRPNPAYEYGNGKDRYLYDLEQAVIEISEGTHSGNELYLFVLANGHHVGNFYLNSDEDKQLYQAFRKGKVEKVHVRIECETQRIFSTDKKGREKIEIEERFRSFLYVKREEK